MPLGGLDSRNLSDALRTRPEPEVAVEERLRVAGFMLPSSCDKGVWGGLDPLGSPSLAMVDCEIEYQRACGNIKVSETVE